MSIEHILLGLLREPASGYDLKAEFDNTIRYFWAAELSQIYTILKRLEKRGWLKSKMQPSDKGPPRKVYALTAAGRRVLREWLGSGPQFSDERYTFLAQIFFMGELGELEETLAFMKQTRDFRQSQLDAYQHIEREVFNGGGDAADNLTDDEFHGYLTLRSGLHTVAARIKWCDETIARIEKRIKSKRRSGAAKKRSKR